MRVISVFTVRSNLNYSIEKEIKIFLVQKQKKNIFLENLLNIWLYKYTHDYKPGAGNYLAWRATFGLKSWWTGRPGGAGN